MLNALLAERCDLSCYLRRPGDYSPGKLRWTYTDALDRRYPWVRMAVLTEQRHDQIQFAQD